MRSRLQQVWPVAVVIALFGQGCASRSPSATSQGTDAGAPICHAPASLTTLVDGATSGPVGGLFLAGDQVYFSTTDGLSRISLNGGQPTLLLPGATGLAVVGATLYYTAGHPVGDAAADGKQSSATALYATTLDQPGPDGGPADGGSSTMVQDNFAAGPLATDADSLYAVGTANTVLKISPPQTSPVTLTLDPTFEIRSIAVDGSYLYAAVADLASQPGEGAIVRMPKSGGGAANTLLTLPGFPDDLVVDQQALYWIDQPAVGTFGNTRVVRTDLNGQNETALVDDSNDGNESPGDIALGGSSLYFLSGSLASVPKSGGAIQQIVPGLTGPGMMQVSGADIVWVDNASRALSSTAATPIEALCVAGP